MASTLISSWLGLCTLKKGANVNIKYGTSVLLATLRNRGKCIQALKGAYANIQNNITSTVRGFMARNRQLTTLNTVINAGADVNTMNLNGIRRRDCDYGHDGDIIDIGADVNTEIQSSRPVVTWAEYHLNSGCIIGTDDNIRRWTPGIGGNDVGTVLRQNSDDRCIGLPSAVETDVSHMEKNGRAIFVKAVGLDHNERNKIVFHTGADVNFNDKQHTRYMRNEYVEVSLEAGVHVNIKDDYGDTAVMWVVHKAYGEYVETLIAAGADVNIQNNFRDTALMWAVCKGDDEHVDTLIAPGPDVNIQNNEGIGVTVKPLIF